MSLYVYTYVYVQMEARALPGGLLLLLSLLWYFETKKFSLNMDFTNLARLTGQKASRMLLSPPYSSLELQECVIIPAFLHGCQASRFRSLCFCRNHVTNQTILPPHGTDFPYRKLGIRTCLLWVLKQLLCKTFNRSFHLLRLVSLHKRVSLSPLRLFFRCCYCSQNDITLAIIQIV